MRAYVIGNEGDDDAGYIGERAQERGYSLSGLIREQSGEWPSLDGIDLIISLGSEWSVYWDHVQPSVDAEIAMLAEAHRRGVPIIGLCFGSQLLARMLGAKVEKAPEAEVGWYSVTPTPAGEEGLIDVGPWFEWHYDRWELPDGAELLAANERSNQAFRLGRTFATQFHPEVTPEIVSFWTHSAGGVAELERLGIDRDELMAETLRETARTKPLAHDLFDSALEVVTSGPAGVIH
jgi:GMP synthase-like glutamine amidotransferase